MICPFVVGQKVVCIYAGGIWGRADSPGTYCSGPKKDDIVKITEIIESGYIDRASGIHMFGLTFVEWPNEGYYFHLNFRPLQDRPKKASIEIFKKLLDPTHKILEKV